MGKIILKKTYFSLGAFLLNFNQEKPEKILTCFQADLCKSRKCNREDYHCYPIPKFLRSSSLHILQITRIRETSILLQCLNLILKRNMPSNYSQNKRKKFTSAHEKEN